MVGGGPAVAGTEETREGGKAGGRRLQPVPPASRGIAREALAPPVDVFRGIVMDLRSWNPKMHLPNPALWAHILARAETVLIELNRLMEEPPDGDGS